MIEPFEFEQIRLQADAPSGHIGKAVLGGLKTVDMQERTTMSDVVKGKPDIQLDQQQLKIYQTRIGNPSNIDSHKAVYVPDRIIAKEPIVTFYDTKSVSDSEVPRCSDLFHSYLDQQAKFIPSISDHKLPSFQVVGQNEPFLTPGLSNIDARKVNFHWM